MKRYGRGNKPVSIKKRVSEQNEINILKYSLEFVIHEIEIIIARPK